MLGRNVIIKINIIVFYYLNMSFNCLLIFSEVNGELVSIKT